MNYDLRLACDTLYFGLSVDDLTFKWLCSEIKNYLFFPLTFDYSRSRSKYYCCEAVNEDNGFFMFFSPHKNLLNDYATIQLTGKFFVDYVHENKIKELIDFLSEFINYQRIDVCLDVLWLDLPYDYDNFTNNLGFPTPKYSDRWKNIRLPFSTYGRWSGQYFINMISCGKSDLRLRVYDKSLEIEEKHHMTYSEYYGFKDEFAHVFRIEYQMRGNALKEFISNIYSIGINPFDLDELCGAIISCLFYKFNFRYLDDVIVNPFYVSTSSARVSTLEGRIEYHKNKSGFHYFKYADLKDEQFERDKENKQIKNIVKQNVNDNFKQLKTIFDFDLEKYSRSEYQDVVKDLPF